MYESCFRVIICNVYASRDIIKSRDLQRAPIGPRDLRFVCRIKCSKYCIQFTCDLVYLVLPVCTRCKMYDNLFLTYVLLFYELFDAFLPFYCFESTPTKTKSQLKDLKKSMLSPCSYPGLIYNTYIPSLSVLISYKPSC